MVCENPSNEELRPILAKAKTIAVVGLSDDPERTSNKIAAIMQNSGYRIIPVNPKVGKILGEKSYSRLQDIPDKIDIINVFRRPEYLPSIAEDAIQTDCKVFWAQLGIKNEDACELLQQHDFTVVMDKCIKVAYQQLINV